MRPALAVLLTTLALTARAQNANNVAVFALNRTNATLSASAAVKLEESIRDAAARVLRPLGYAVLTADNTIARIRAAGGDGKQLCSDSTSCVVDMGKAVDARYVISGAVASEDGIHSVFVRLYDVTTGEMLSSLKLKGRSGNEIEDAFDARSKELFEGAGLLKRGTASTSPAPQPPQRTPAADGSLEVTFETNDESAGGPGEGYFTSIVDARGVATNCTEKVTQDTACTLRLRPGEYTVRTTGAARLDHGIHLLEGGERYRLWHDSPVPDLAWAATLLTVITGAVGVIGILAGGYELHDYQGGLFLVAGGAIVALIYPLVATRQRHEGVARRVLGPDWRPRANPVVRGFGAFLTVAGALSAATFTILGFAEAGSGEMDAELVFPAVAGFSATVIGAWLMTWDAYGQAVWEDAERADDEHRLQRAKARGQSSLQFRGIGLARGEREGGSVVASFGF